MFCLGGGGEDLDDKVILLQFTEVEWKKICEESYSSFEHEIQAPSPPNHQEKKGKQKYPLVKRSGLVKKKKQPGSLPGHPQYS